MMNNVHSVFKVNMLSFLMDDFDDEEDENYHNKKHHDRHRLEKFQIGRKRFC